MFGKGTWMENLCAHKYLFRLIGSAYDGCDSAKGKVNNKTKILSCHINSLIWYIS